MPSLQKWTGFIKYFLRQLSLGGLAITISMAIATVLMTYCWWLAGCIISVFIALLAGFWFYREPFAMIVLMILISATGIVTSVLQPYRLFGETVSNISVADSARFTSASIFYFNDAKLLPSYQGFAVAVGKYQRQLYDVTVIPIVPDNWQTGDPIPAWAARPPHSVGYIEPEDSTYRRIDENLQQPNRAGIRVVQNPDDYLAAIKSVERKFKLVSVPNAPVIVWLSQPELALTEMRWHLLQLLLGMWLCWSIALFSNLIYLRIKPASSNADLGSTE